MSGVRKDGILEVSQGSGAGTPVDIVSPIGPSVKAGSVSVTLATDEDPIDVVSTLPSDTTTSGLINAAGQTITLLIPEGYNSLLVRISNVASFVGTLHFFESSNVANKLFGLSLIESLWSDSPIFLTGDDELFVIPALSGKTIGIHCETYSSGSVNIELIASVSQAVQNGLTNAELRNASVPISGTVSVTEPVTVDAVDLDIRNLAFATDKVDITGSIVTQIKTSTANQTSVADSATSVTILAGNAARLGATITNTSTATLRARLSLSAATLTNYTVPIVSGAYYEVPFGYTGAITGIWDTDPNDGSALVTEMVPI